MVQKAGYYRWPVLQLETQQKGQRGIAVNKGKSLTNTKKDVQDIILEHTPFGLELGLQLV